MHARRCRRVLERSTRPEGKARAGEHNGGRRGKRGPFHHAVMVRPTASHSTAETSPHSWVSFNTLLIVSAMMEPRMCLPEEPREGGDEVDCVAVVDQVRPGSGPSWTLGPRWELCGRPWKRSVCQARERLDGRTLPTRGRRSTHGLAHLYWRGRRQLSLSRLNHGQPGVQAHPEIVQGATELYHHITDTFFPQTDAVFHDAAALDTAVDVLNP